MFIYLVVLLGFLLRINFIIKPEGLWNDEYVSWSVAATHFNQGFWEEILKQCHMPLYYLYLKPFAHCSDLILRLTSLIPSVIAIWAMYLVGKEFSPKCAKYSALITAILPFLVYYSQEVRFYSIVFLLSALILLFLIRTLKNFHKHNILLYSVFSGLLIFTHVLGIIYVFFMTLYLIYKKKSLSWKIITALIIGILFILPFGINILRQLPSSQWWGVFSYTNLMFLFSDFFSPILTNNVNAPPVFYYNNSLVFALMITVPTLIGILGIFFSLKKLKGFLVISLCVVIGMTILAVTGQIVFITKYSIEILPILILALSLGYSDGNKLKYFLFVVFLTFNILAILTPYYPSKQIRTEGHNLPAVILNSQNPDTIIYTYYAPDRFRRYLKISPVSKHISKSNRFEYLENPAQILNDIESGKKVSVVFLNSVSFIPENRIEEAKTKNMPEMFITFSKIRNELEKYALNNFKNISIKHAGEWIILSGKKI